MKLLIATTNKGKIEMFKSIFRRKAIYIVFLNQIGFKGEPPAENGKTPEENALIKARYYCQKTGLPTLADDSGFCIDALNGEPGVMARRWGGELPDKISDEDWLTHYENRIRRVRRKKITGSFPFSRAIAFPDGRTFVQNDKIEILLSKTPRRPFQAGFPVSSVHVFPDGRHSLDVSHDDPVWRQHWKKEGFFDLLKRAGLVAE